MHHKSSDSQSLRVGFVGAGGIAPEHADTLAVLDGVDLVAVCDFDTYRARSLADTYKVPSVYSSLAEMMAQEKLDVIHVLTQPQHHVAVATECLRGGVNTYIEKPMALSTADCELIRQEAASRGLIAGVNHQFAHSNPVEAILQAAREQRLGRINHVSVSYCVSPQGLPVREIDHYMFSSPSAFLFEYCPHPFSIIRPLVGNPLQVNSLASQPTTLENGKTFYRSIDVSAVTDRGTAHLFFSAGRGNAEFTVSVYAQDARVDVDILRGTIVFHENDRFPVTAKLRDGIRSAATLFQQASGNMLNDRAVRLKLKSPSVEDRFYPTMKAFYEGLRNHQPVSEDAAAGKQVVAFCEMAAANMKTVD